jgi:hypothetical protein
MPCPQRSSEGLPISADLLQASLDTGFALLRLAVTQSTRDARRARREARSACREGERRLAASRDPSLQHFRPRFAELSRAIERAGSAKRLHRRPLARVLQMPPAH